MATLYKKRGYWHIDYMLGGKKKMKKTNLVSSESNRQKAEALKAVIEKALKQEKLNNTFDKLITNDLSLNKALKEYESNLLKYKSFSHKHNFEIIMKRFKKIVSGTNYVRQITKQDIFEFVSQMKDLAQATQRTYFQYLIGFFNFLKEYNYIDYIPLAKGIRPKKAKKNIINFDDDDLTQILKEAKLRDIRYYKAFKMLLLTGQRPGDVLRLLIRDIDFNRGIIYFSISKTRSEFKFPIYGILEQFLRNEMPEILTKNKDEYIFPGLSVGAISQAMRKIKIKLKLGNRHYYNLKTFRKYFATQMSKMGMTIQEVQALLDHKSPETTLRYYADVRAEELKNKIDKLQN